MPISILTAEGLAKLLQKIKTVFATKSDLTFEINELDSNVVHKTEDEAISGTKIFLVNSPSESDISINGLQMVASDPSVTRYGTPSKNKYLSTCYWSSEALANPITSSNYRNYLLGCMEYASRSDGQRDLKLFCCKPDNSGYITNKLMLGFDKDGVSFAQAPSTSTTRTAGADIVTRDFIPNDTRIVHTTGNETIAGTKTFSSTISGTADKALKDGDGSTISSTYLKLSGGTMTDSVTMTGNSKSFIVANGTYTTSLQIGSGGVNRGLWDTTLNKWIVYANASNCFLNGNASTATKLETARTINGVSFDGSANITVADSTKLPLAGGALTGSLRCTAKYTSADTNYTSDLLTFNSGNNSYGNNVALGGGGNTIIGGGESYSAQLSALAGNGAEACYVCADNAIYLKSNCNTFANAKTTTIGTDGKVACPQGFVGTIAASSDIRLKKDIESISSRMLDAWDGIEWVQFKFKADDSKMHFGIIAQDLNKRLSDSGIDASFCTIAESNPNYDPATMDELPEALVVNYIEALVIEAAYLRRKCRMLEDRISALEVMS